MNELPKKNLGNLLEFNGDLINERKNSYDNNYYQPYCNTNASYNYHKRNLVEFPCMNYLTNTKRKNNIPKKINTFNNTQYGFYSNRQSKRDEFFQENNKKLNYSSYDNRIKSPLNNHKIGKNNSFDLKKKQKNKISNKKLKDENCSSNNFEIIRNLSNLMPQISNCALFPSSKNSNINTNKTNKSSKKINSSVTKSNTNNNFSLANSNKAIDKLFNKTNELFYSFTPGYISSGNLNYVNNNKQTHNQSNSTNSYMNPSTLSQTAKNFCINKNSGSSLLEDDKKNLLFKNNLEIAQNEINEYFMNDSVIKGNKNDCRRNTPQSMQSIQSLSDSQIFELANHYITEDDDSFDKYKMNNIIYNKKKRIQKDNNLIKNNNDKSNNSNNKKDNDRNESKNNGRKKNNNIKNNNQKRKK